jgi:pyrimidine-nucleoside phosphorylase
MAVPFTMSVYELIRRKRDRGVLTAPEIESLVSGYTKGDVPDYQMAALLMAIFLRGMTPEETSALAMAMMNSGDVFDLSGIAGAKVDKHSTGGVGDKVSLILAPLVAACGVKVPMVSGRALGHTGGTLDKLESIPGFKTDLTFSQFKKTVSSVGVAMMGQTRTMCPADRKLYALRDVTATVDSIPLIAASIMSKKLAEGVDGLVLDVKTGAGAFMSRPEQARHLARTMIGIGTELGRKVVALVTDMSEPLGAAVGNALEVAESIDALHGKWEPDLEEVTLALGEEMLVMAGRAKSAQQARRLLLRALNDGAAFEKFRQMVRAQGGDVRAVEDPGLLPKAGHSQKVTARAGGFVKAIDCLQVGLLGVQLGVGRSTLDSKIEPGAGFRFLKKTGAKVAAGDVLAEVFASDAAKARDAAIRLGTLITVGPSLPRARKLIETRLTRP